LKQVYAKIKGGFQSFFQAGARLRPAFCGLLIAALVSGCAGGYGGTSTPWDMTGSQGIITKDPNSLPDISWQTTQQRRELITQNNAVQQEPLAPVPGAAARRSVNVAILLPLSGKYADLGQSMLKSAQMALFDVGSAQFELMPQDTHSTPDGAVQAAQAAITARADLILGPIFADDVRAVKPVAAAANVPVIAFTTDWTLAGRDTYIMGFLPFAQVSRVAQFAQSQGLKRVAALAPQTEYCDVVVNTLNRTGLQVTETKRYDPATADLTPVIADFAARTKAINASGVEAPDFSALVLPVGGEGLKAVVSLLDLNGIDNTQVRFLGTGLWDDDTLTSNPALYGSWFAAPDPTLRRDFEKRYQSNYGAMPPRLATLAYDATAMAAVLARTNAGDGTPYTRDALTHPRGFAGLDGIFRLRPDGLTDRGLAVLEIQSGRARVVDPAPTAFGG
jgi:ABC-type branched-subunit amino acid transport system substrate-binding protein